MKSKRSDLIYLSAALRGERRRRILEERLMPWITWGLIGLVAVFVVLPMLYHILSR